MTNSLASTHDERKEKAMLRIATWPISALLLFIQHLLTLADVNIAQLGRIVVAAAQKVIDIALAAALGEVKEVRTAQRTEHSLCIVTDACRRDGSNLSVTNQTELQA